MHLHQQTDMMILRGITMTCRAEQFHRVPSIHSANVVFPEGSFRPARFWELEHIRRSIASSAGVSLYIRACQESNERIPLELRLNRAEPRSSIILNSNCQMYSFFVETLAAQTS